MTISTYDQWIAAAVQSMIQIDKTASMTTVAAIPFSPFAQAGNPGAGTLAGTSTTTGVVPTDATAGCPIINPFGGANVGEISRLVFSNTVACKMMLYDLLWKGGAYTFNASTTGQSPTSFASRIPNGTDYNGLELWFEQVTAATGIQSVAVTYNDEGGASSSTGTISQGTAGIVGRMTQMPLAAGDKGIQGVTGVVGSVASAGTFNVLVMRRLGEGRIRVAGDVDRQDMFATGRPQIFADSALYLVVQADSTASGLPEVLIDIKNG